MSDTNLIWVSVGVILFHGMTMVGVLVWATNITMRVRITRPALLEGVQALAKSSDPVPHLPSIERWRKGSRRRPYDVNEEASRQEMRL